MILYSLARVLVFPFVKMFSPCKKLGYKDQPFDGATMVVSNHLSNLDVFLVGSSFKGQSYFLCKKELTKSKFNAFMVKHLGGIAIDRDKPEFSEIKQCLQTLKDGKRLVVFPEGTRNKNNDGELLPIKDGAGLFAFKSKARIIPIYISKKSRIFRKNYAYVGEPFDLSEFYGVKYSQELASQITEKIRNEILKCKDLYEKYMADKAEKKLNKKNKKK